MVYHYKPGEHNTSIKHKKILEATHESSVRATKNQIYRVI